MTRNLWTHIRSNCKFFRFLLQIKIETETKWIDFIQSREIVYVDIIKYFQLSIFTNLRITASNLLQIMLKALTIWALDPTTDAIRSMLDESEILTLAPLWQRIKNTKINNKSEISLIQLMLLKYFHYHAFWYSSSNALCQLAHHFECVWCYHKQICNQKSSITLFLRCMKTTCLLPIQSNHSGSTAKRLFTRGAI